MDILSIHGPLLCELILLHGIKSVYYKTKIEWYTISKSLILKHAIKNLKTEYKINNKIPCFNHCGKSILIVIPTILEELPLCCGCKNYWSCVDCTNNPIINRCRCGKRFHKDPEYRGRYQKCEHCR